MRSITSVGLARSRDELEFLPSTLKLIETPVSPLGRLGIFVPIVIVTVGFAWAAVGKVDVIAIAEGRIVSVARTKTVQSLDAAVVRSLKVRDGDRVKAGDILIELDPTDSIADLSRTQRDLAQAVADIGRTQAFLSGGRLLRSVDVDPATLATATALLDRQRSQQRQKLAALTEQLSAKHDGVTALEAEGVKLSAALPLVRQRASIREASVATGFGPRLPMLEAQQAAIEAEHAIIENRARVDEAKAQGSAVERDRAAAESDFDRIAPTDRAKAEQQTTDLRRELDKITRRAELRTLRAPVAGTVQQLAIHTVGGIVEPGATLAIIVPTNGGLEIEVELPNHDVGFVHAGQRAAIKVEAFDLTKYGLIDGRVVSVSRDVIAAERPGLPARGASRAISVTAVPRMIIAHPATSRV